MIQSLNFFVFNVFQQSSVGGAESHTHSHRWNSLEVTRGSFGPEDFAPDVIEIKFERAVSIKVGYSLFGDSFS